jgi:DNA ligase-1
VSTATLQQFATVGDAAAGTTKKLQKQAILADYFRSVGDDEALRLAVRFSAGRAFPATEERVLNVGWSNVSQVVLPMVGLGAGEYHALVVKSGEIGEALSKAWDGKPALPDAGPGGELTLKDLSAAFEELASTGNTERKREILRGLYGRCRTGREAAYLSKIIFREMRTGVQEGVLQAAVAQAFGKELKDVQRTQLLVGNLDDVAVLARRDALAGARFTLFHPIQFMLATPVETPEEAQAAIEGRTFYCEDKLDGIRAQVHKAGDKVAIYTRTMDRTDASFPDVVEQVRKIPGEFLLDGEIVPYANGQVLPFANIQKRLGRKVLTPKILREHPARFVAFDILYLNGGLLMDCPLNERRAALRSLCESCGEVRDGQVTGEPQKVTPPIPLLTTHEEEVSTAEEVAREFENARTRRNEGIILKDPASPYSPGRRGRMWFKLKTHLPTLDCVVTAAEYGHGKRRNVLSDYTFAVWDREPTEAGARLVNVGKAYSGVTDREIAELTELFLSIATGQYGRVYAVPPRVVLEIAFDQIQRSERHESGFAFRFPRIKRIRTDKRPEDADRLGRVEEIYRSLPNFARPEVERAGPGVEPGLFDHLG